MIYFTVGPAQLHQKFNVFLKEAMKKDVPSVSHRGIFFTSLYLDLQKNLHKLLRLPKGGRVTFFSSASECMERTIEGFSAKTSLHFVSGSFGQRAYDFAVRSGRQATAIDMEVDGSFSLDKVPTDICPEIVFTTHNETSSGQIIPGEFIKSLRKRFPGAVIICDATSSAPFLDFDTKDVDVIFFSVQKLFGMPAGLAVCTINAKTISKARKGVFRDFKDMLELGKKGMTLETPNVLLLYILNLVTKDYLKTGIVKLRETIKLRAQKIYGSVRLPMYIQNSSWRSDFVLVFKTKNSVKVVDMLAKAGCTIATGYDEEKMTRIRIGNFPQHSAANVDKLLKLLKKVHE